MRILLFAVLIAMAVSEQIEFYSIDNRVADPCVNQQRLDGLLMRPDCAANSLMPGASNTFLIGDNAVVATTLPTLQTVSIVGRFFPAAGFIGFSSSETCGPAANFVAGPNTLVFPVTASTTAGLSSMVLTLASWTTLTTNWVTPVVNPVPTAVTSNLVTSTWTETSYTTQAGLGINEPNARMICYSTSGLTNTWQWTGLRIGVVFSCQSDNAVDQTRRCVFKPNRPVADVTETQKAVYRAQSYCCLANGQKLVRTSQCINPNTQTCCGSTAVGVQQKCCNESIETVAWADGTCPCNVGNSATACPYLETCCLPTKYTDLVSSTDTYRQGECYNPRYYRCCDTGNKYDPGTDQCCVVNGLQSVNVPCPCSQNSHCFGSQTNGYQFTDFACCMQTAPAPIEPQVRSVASCSPYQNYPSGTGHFSVQQCAGQCYDTKYAMCCNGRTCIANFERCCNTTCCNRYIGTCQSGTLRTGSSRSNFIDVGITYDVCTTVEQIDLIRAWWMFVMPSFMLIATLSSLAIALVFAGRVEHSARRALEKGMIVAAVIAVMFSCCTFFAPIYKYGIVIVFISLFAIITSAARNVNMYIACIILQVFLLIYLIDPFHGNDYLNLAVDRNAFGRADPYSAGLWHATSRIWDVHASCWDFYEQYFKFDPLIRDNVRVDEPNNPAFGYCSRGWVSALLVFDGFIIIAVLTQFILDVIVLLLRARMMTKAEDVKWQP